MKTFLLFLLTTVSLSANDKFYQANEAFQKGKYDQAIEILESYKDFSFARFMNLGHAYLQKNDENRAWLNFERAKQIRPYSSEVDAAFVQLKSGDLKKNFVFFGETWLCLQILAVLSILASCIFAVFGFLGIKRSKIYKKTLIGSAVAWLAMIIFMFQSRQIIHKGITIANDIPLYISPSAKSQEITRIQSPQGVIVSQEYGNFAYVEIPGMKISGWIDRNNIEMILKR